MTLCKMKSYWMILQDRLFCNAFGTITGTNQISHAYKGKKNSRKGVKSPVSVIMFKPFLHRTIADVSSCPFS